MVKQAEEQKSTEDKSKLNFLQLKIREGLKSSKEGKISFFQIVQKFFSYLLPLFLLDSLGSLYCNKVEDETNWFVALTNFKRPSAMWVYWTILSAFVTNLIYEHYRNTLNKDLNLKRYNFFALASLLIAILFESCYILCLGYLYYKSVNKISLIQKLVYRYSGSNHKYSYTCSVIRKQIYENKTFAFILFTILKAYYLSYYVFFSVVVSTAIRWVLNFVSKYSLKEECKDYNDKDLLVGRASSIDVRNSLFAISLDILLLMIAKRYNRKIHFCCYLVDFVIKGSLGNVYLNIATLVLFWIFSTLWALSCIRRYVVEEALVKAPPVSIIEGSITLYQCTKIIVKKLLKGVGTGFFFGEPSEVDLENKERKEEAGHDSLQRVCEKVGLVCFLNTHHVFWKVGVFVLYKKNADARNCIALSYWDNCLTRYLKALSSKLVFYFVILSLAFYLSNRKKNASKSKLGLIPLVCYFILLYPMILVLLIERKIVDPTNCILYYNMVSYSLRLILFKAEIYACLGNKYLTEFVISTETVADVLAEICGRTVENLKYAPYIGGFITGASLISYIRMLAISNQDQQRLMVQTEQIRTLSISNQDQQRLVVQIEQEEVKIRESYISQLRTNNDLRRMLCAWMKHCKAVSEKEAKEAVSEEEAKEAVSEEEKLLRSLLEKVDFSGLPECLEAIALMQSALGEKLDQEDQQTFYRLLKEWYAQFLRAAVQNVLVQKVREKLVQKDQQIFYHNLKKWYENTLNSFSFKKNSHLE